MGINQGANHRRRQTGLWTLLFSGPPRRQRALGPLLPAWVLRSEAVRVDKPNVSSSSSKRLRSTAVSKSEATTPFAGLGSSSSQRLAALGTAALAATGVGALAGAGPEAGAGARAGVGTGAGAGAGAAFVGFDTSGETGRSSNLHHHRRRRDFLQVLHVSADRETVEQSKR